MSFRWIVTSVSILASILAISTPAKANISFSTVEPGTLEIVPGNFHVLESVTPVTIRVQSSDSATISVSSPTLVSGSTSDPNGTEQTAFFRSGATRERSGGTSAIVTIPPGSTEIEIEMRVQRPIPFVAGTYKYEVMLTVIP
jgi:hypothetical protein